ncbi:MAG: hypothetical protein GEU90_00465 [Gemmatimonas sp.]|nr:hypothetical protein [Gemmatimonas sp.]
MVNFPALERELREHLTALAPDQQRQVLEYARALGAGPRRGVPGGALLRFAGALEQGEAAELRRAVEDCETIDPNGW